MQTTTAAPVARAPGDAAGAGRRRKRAGGRSRRRALAGLGYAAPTAAVVGLLFLVPLVLVVWMSLHHWPLLGNPTFNAPKNYTDVAHNTLVATAAWFTVKYTVVTTVVLFTISFGLALMVQHPRPGVGLLRTAFFLPAAVGFATASLLFLGFLSSAIGPVNPVLEHLGLINAPVDWITGSPGGALASTVTLVTWRFAGFNMLILLTGLQAIPVELYEAARMDGCSRWQTLRRITIPLLRPTIALVLIVMTTGSLLAFDQFYILTKGGPDDSTTSVVMVIVREAFVRFDLGSSAALSVLVLLVLLVLNVVQLSFLRRREEK
ncbi:sugar ABC transporter permease [Actinospica durhamensis]|uniref:Sugar ABC transporter permease n=1 Tax=Actinospica durhamensis TaxID=1508375 RepID=A0A941ENL9_9ACTN|nr:sugar ABC transporter permease [Actinospica durhamensis]MBR7835715.1 sugar ABC transporter permease [Actinospica durhamensis]